MGAQVEGRRVDVVDQMERPGDFCFWHVSDDGQFAFMAFRCPCGCGATDSVPVRQGVKEEGSWQWDGNRDQPTLSPSLHKQSGCRWHGFLQAGKWNQV